MSSILTNNDVNKISDLAGDYLNARTHGNFVGNGTFKDTECLINLNRVAYRSGRKIFIPPNIYYIHHPVNHTASVTIEGCGHGTTAFGTEIRPSIDFDINYNPNGVKASMFQGQIDTDPSGQGRWNSSNGLVWHDAHLKHIVFRNQYDNNPAHKIANLNGFSSYYSGENSSLEDLWIEGFETNYWLTGNSATFTAILCSSWNSTQGGWRFEKHPLIGLLGNYGVARIIAPSGDKNTPQVFHITGGRTIIIDALKQEWPINLTDNTITIDTAPESIGTGGDYFSSVELRAAGCDLRGGTDSQAITNLVGIEHTGTANAAEFPRCHVRIMGGYFYGVTNAIKDNCNGGLIVPLSSANVDYFRPAANFDIRYNGGGHKLYGAPVVFDESTVANAPAAGTFKNGHWKFSNGRKAGEGGGAGTGIFGWSDGVNWRTYYDNTIVAA